MGVAWWAPGRVNLIGEHTDYNAGFALPFAIEQGCLATVDSGDEAGILTVSSAQFDQTRRLDAAKLVPRTEGWSDYVAGVVHGLRELGVSVPSLRITVDSDVPVGSGLSSSAALTCSTATAINDFLQLGLGADELLSVTRHAENAFVGAPTGGMDQLASLRCTAGHVLLCDMATLVTTAIPFDPAAAGLSLLVIDSRAPHRHADGEYRLRRAGCERAASILGVASLRQIGPDDLASALRRLPSDELQRYTRHVVTENARVLEVVALLEAGMLTSIGNLLTESHRSMREDYRITVDQLDVAVQTLLDEGALGARMTGGGFGGCVIALIDAERAQAAAEAVRAAYLARSFTAPRWFTTRPSHGAHRVDA